MRNLCWLIVVFFLAGCSSLPKRPIDYIPGSSPDDFLERYYFLLDKKAQKAYKELKTLEEKNNFIEKFWKDYDPKPDTEENEFRLAIERRIDDVKNEKLVSDQDVFGFKFREHGGYRGQAARVYLLYGPPHLRRQLTDNIYLADMMVWYYGDGSGRPLFRFLFFRKGDAGAYRLFDNHFVSYWDRLIELKKNSFMVSGDELIGADDELRRLDPEYLFISAIFEFSPLGMSVQEALEPQLSAEKIFRKSGSALVGVAPSISSKRKFQFSPYKSMIVGDVRAYYSNDRLNAYFVAQRSDLDWEILDDKAKLEMRVDIRFTNLDDSRTFLYRMILSFQAPANSLASTSNPYVYLHIPQSIPAQRIFKEEILSINELPPGRYRMNVYLKNLHTYKDGFWEKEFVKK